MFFTSRVCKCPLYKRARNNALDKVEIHFGEQDTAGDVCIYTHVVKLREFIRSESSIQESPENENAI